MSIVLNECEWADRAIQEHDLGRKPYETLVRVAKYYLSAGMSKSDVREKLDEFLLSCDSSQSTVRWSDTMDRALKYALKYPAVEIDSISITRSEMKLLNDIQGVQAQRLAFTLLCIAKYLNIVSPNTKYWVSTPNSEIMKMANITTSLKRQSALFRQLRDLNLIKFSKRIDNLSVQVLFVDNSVDTVMSVSDFRSLGNQYMMFCGGRFYKCAVCGLVCRDTSKKHQLGGSKKKYCKECAIKIHKKQKVDSVMRIKSGKSCI